MIHVDAEAARAVTQAIGSIGAKVDTDIHISQLMDAAFSIMKEDFDVFMTGMAQTQPARFHHVYEWGQENIGNPDMALWEIYQQGNGRNREITWRWLPSVTEVPLPDIPPGPNGEELQGGHIFVWKAPVMEYGQAVTIRRRNAKALAFPNPRVEEDRPLIFHQGPVVMRNVGGEAATGAFTTTFSEWFAGPSAESSLEDALVRGTEVEFRKAWESSTRPLTRRSVKSASMTVNPLSAAVGEGISDSIMNALVHHYNRHEGRGIRG